VGPEVILSRRIEIHAQREEDRVVKWSLAVSAVVACLATIFLTGCDACATYEAAQVRGSNIRSMIAIRDVAIALEQYRNDHGSYPPGKSIVDLQETLAPLLTNTQRTDRWGEPLVVDVTSDRYTLTSKGDDRIGGHEFGGAVTSPGHSITLKDAVFVQFDASVEKAARKYEAEIAKLRAQKR